MSERPKSRNVGLYIVLGVIAVIVIGGIALVMAAMYFGRGFMETMGEIGKGGSIAVEVASALEDYLHETGEFPETLDDLGEHLSPATLDEVTRTFVYVKPEADAPDDTVVAYTEDKVLIQGAMMRIEIHKDFQVWSVTRQPVPQSGSRAAREEQEEP
ncbi:MAG: hypothetical protein IH851_04390 [Armatimonadetes bacterium]|nr:hypothetical protein [Armatimonadota bacterium]